MRLTMCTRFQATGLCIPCLVSLITGTNHSSDVQRKFHQFLMCYTFILPDTDQLLLQWCPFMTSNCPVLSDLLCSHCTLHVLHTPIVRDSGSVSDGIDFCSKFYICLTSV